MRHFPSTIAISVALATAAWAAPAAAQDASTAPVAEDSGLGDIVVTAQRREESLQDVPVAVSVLSGNTLDAITSTGSDVRVLAGRVPSLNIESSFGRTFPRFYIRGLGNTDFDLNASQPVSVVYDDVVLENPILKGFPIFDLDRIEVLRGPQGTLFGRNTPAGIVKFDTVKPGNRRLCPRQLWPLRHHAGRGRSRRRRRQRFLGPPFDAVPAPRQLGRQYRDDQEERPWRL